MGNINTQLQDFSSECIDFIHIDVMDGHFVPPITFGEEFVKNLKTPPNIKLDIHLMVDNPEKEVPKYFIFNPYCISFHFEATKFPIRLCKEIQNQSILSGIAINPGTSIDLLEPILPFVDIILLMSVEPGYYGQKFLPTTFERLQKLNVLRQKYSFDIQVDGGVGKDNITELSQANVNIVAVASGLFKSKMDPNKSALELKKLTNGI